MKKPKDKNSLYSTLTLPKCSKTTTKQSNQKIYLIKQKSYTNSSATDYIQADQLYYLDGYYSIARNFLNDAKQKTNVANFE